MAENFTAEKTENLITTYMERSLHASLKAYFCPDELYHEVKIGRFAAIIEVPQTRFYTDITLNSGANSWGFTKGTGAKALDVSA